MPALVLTAFALANLLFVFGLLGQGTVFCLVFKVTDSLLDSGP
jgi:hypothetical protein